MKTLGQRIHDLDLSLYAAIESATSADDRRSLLLIQDSVRRNPPYVYLEIGSHMGGTIQPYYADPECRKIYSIDKRPAYQPDERGKLFFYEQNSTKIMLDKLEQAFPEIGKDKIETFDANAADLDVRFIQQRPNLCFIDGEHTNRAVVSDFGFCRRVCSSDVVIAFHDSCYIVDGIEKIKVDLASQGIPFLGMKLGGSIYVILLGEAIEKHGERLKKLAIDEAEYFRQSHDELERIRREARWHTWLGQYPWIYSTLRAVKHYFIR